MNRQSLIQLLIGVLAMLAGLATFQAIRKDRCLDAGGQWVAASRSCTGPNGPLTVGSIFDIIAGIVVGVLIAFMLHRASTFANRRTGGPA